MTVEAIIVRDPDGPTSVWVLIDGEPVEMVESCIDAGAGWNWEDWTEHRDLILGRASPAARVVVMSRVPANVVEVTVETHVWILGQRIKVTPGLTRWIPAPVRKRLRAAYGLA